jgi:hypothetical protein
MLCPSATINGAAFSRQLARHTINPEMPCALVGKGEARKGPRFTCPRMRLDRSTVGPPKP